jgi:molybdopterin-containing oxidoreductase family iron-sulfur binding subunit
MSTTKTTSKRYGMVIDLDRCSGCGSCAVACATENNVAPAGEHVTPRNGVTWLRLYKLRNTQDGSSAFVPLFCQQCEETPCVDVCPQQAVEVDAQTGIVEQIPVRCLGCRYCMVACPYQARYFNWWDPAWPGEVAKSLNPTVSLRMRGVVEKCNLCHGRLHQAEDKAAAAGGTKVHFLPACVEACPSQAITFGDLADPSSDAAKLASDPNAFRLLDSLGTKPKVSFVTRRQWVREAAYAAAKPKEAKHA